MKKYILSITVGILFIGYLVFAKKQDTMAAAVAVATTETEPSTTSASPATSSAVASLAAPTYPSTSISEAVPASSPSAAQAGQYKDGSYTGPVVNAIYGNIQVQAVITGGRLAGVEFLQYPDKVGHSQQVSAFAKPKLASEAISAQSANVDIVSGATQDSQAFIKSLGAALSQAS